jgi:hypothetical protein
VIPATGQSVTALDAHGREWPATAATRAYRGTSRATADEMFAPLDFHDGKPPIPWPCAAIRLPKETRP